MAKRKAKAKGPPYEELNVHVDPAWNAFLAELARAQDLASRLDDATPRMLIAIMLMAYENPDSDRSGEGEKEEVRKELAAVVRKAFRIFGQGSRYRVRPDVTRAQQVISLHLSMADVLVGARQVYPGPLEDFAGSRNCCLCFNKDLLDMFLADATGDQCAMECVKAAGDRLRNASSYLLRNGEAVVRWNRKDEGAVFAHLSCANGDAYSKVLAYWFVSDLGEHLQALVGLPIYGGEGHTKEHYVAMLKLVEVFARLPRVIVDQNATPLFSGSELATTCVREGLIALGATKQEVRAALDPWRKHVEAVDRGAAVDQQAAGEAKRRGGRRTA